MIIESTRLGRIEISNEEIISFPQGLPGFPQEKAFVLLPHQADSPFFFLQSVSDVDLTFLVVEPFAFFTDYEFELDDQVVSELGLSEDNRPQIYNIVTIPKKPEEMTANLLAPVIINTQKRIARQLVLEKTVCGTRQRLFVDKTPVEEGGR